VDDDQELLRRELARERAARKQAEQLLEQKSLELYHRNQELEREVAERRRVEASLREQGAALARSNADLEQFAYVASHDLQAPLRGMVGFSQLLARRLEDRLDDESREYLQFIDESARRLRDVIHDLLEFSRAGRGGGPLVELPLAEPLRRALAELDPVLRASGAQVVQAVLPGVMGESTGLMQLLRNLIDNAIKYVRPGVVPLIRVDAERQGEWVQVSVADNGIGIPAEHRERVFQIFQRLHTPEEYPGTGVGLAICEKVLRHHGGRIWVEAAADGGSIFYFTLKAA